MVVDAKPKIWSTVLGWFFVESLGVRVGVDTLWPAVNSCRNSAGLVANS